MVGTPSKEWSLSSLSRQRNRGSERVNGDPSRGRWKSPTSEPRALRPESALPPGFPPAEKFSQMLSINEELQARLAQGLTGPSRAAPGPRAPEPRAPEPQLSPRSNASEVRAWLQGKGFSSG